MSQAEFVPFSTFIDTTFWAELNRRKLHEWRLDETPRYMSGSFSLVETVGECCWLSLGHESFQQSDANVCNGQLLLFNTLENFKGLDRKALLRREAQKVWDLIVSGEWLYHPDRLTTFIFTVFADLKKYQYYYWNCFPTLCFPSQIKQEVVYADPSPVRGRAGWPLRNLVAAVAYSKPSWNSCSFISLREGNHLEEFKISWEQANVNDFPPTVGWERTHEGKMVPQFADMRKQFDPKKLMEQSVGLNLSLIKWRLVPEMRLERYSSLSVLIFGAGTLGSNIARCLMGWGVKKITFVDNSSVSYSNPVRQSLSEFEDARESRGKAETAAAALRRIYPSIDSQAIRLTVPMPGHTVSSSEQKKKRLSTKSDGCSTPFVPQLSRMVPALSGRDVFTEETSLERDVALVDDLVAKHDVVFLALDSREARWLPTMLATKHGKMAFSVALGFDNYVVIRHGVKNDAADHQSASGIISVKEGTLIPYSDLACYFCSDVTAPGNSTTDRTLDQQCTMTPCVRRFEKCIACGNTVAEEYIARGADFVKEVMNCPSYLEKLTGLDQLQASVDSVHIEFSDDSDSVMSL
ncbi:hypothetical protein ANCCEY_09683 [Ancylostoma ceylanicum]|uniref:Ubiquitin-like modifier-activating enzyme ATG7 n=1 Tax=Ancylostoma ceylanicum TaxID=53326 RepID=A0A0D6LMD1_9BILA|nr:hypothetical protein ANCCEY_09683 [Ancylostoma ceylanicum]